MNLKSAGMRFSLIMTLVSLAGIGAVFAEPQVFFTDIVSGPNSGG